MAVSQHIWHCGAGLPGDVLITDLRAYRYGPHFHDAWSIGAIDYGACAFTVRDAPHLAQAGDLVVIAPGDVHTGGTSETPLGYRMLYVEPSWLDDHARALLGAAAAFDGPVIRDPALCAQWLAALAPQDMDEAGRAERISAALFALLRGTRAPPGRWRPRMRMSATSCARAWRRIRPARRTWRRWPGRRPATAPRWSSSSRAATACRRRLVAQLARGAGARTAARRPAAGRRRACRGLRRSGSHDAGVQAGLRQHAGRVPQGLGCRPAALKGRYGIPDSHVMDNH